jgi:hypothetical protein
VAGSVLRPGNTGQGQLHLESPTLALHDPALILLYMLKTFFLKKISTYKGNELVPQNLHLTPETKKKKKKAKLNIT